MAAHDKESRKNAGAIWSNQVRKVLLAAVGAVVLAQEEIEEFVNRLVKKGEMAEHEGKKLIGDILARRKKQVKNEVSTLETNVQSRIETVLHKVRLVSKKDVDALSSKIDALSSVVDRLSKTKHAN